MLLCLSLVAASLLLSLPLTWLVRASSHRLRTFDTAPVAGQIKAPTRRIPNTGGIAIFWSFVAPVLLGLAAVWFAPTSLQAWLPQVGPHLDGLRQETPVALSLLASLTILHVMGLLDDRKPLGPFVKLAIMVLPAVLATTVGRTRLLTLLDPAEGFPIWSTLVTLLWFLVVTNAMNFMDNMDGLSAGCAATACTFFLISATTGGQWFVAACLSLLLGSLIGFLAFNRPPATIFMGDGGSLVIGFLLAFLTTRTTFYHAASSGHWFSVLTPLVVLAVPLYDFTTVTLIRLKAGKSPFVGDLNHLSHRLVRRGLSKPAAVGIMCGLTAVTGVSGVLLRHADGPGAILIGVQVVLLLLVVAALEYATSPASDDQGASR